MRIRQPLERRERLQRRAHRFGGQRASVEPAGAEADHRLFSIDHFEREVRPHADHDHVDRVGADVDGGNTHRFVRGLGNLGTGEPVPSFLGPLVPDL